LIQLEEKRRSLASNAATVEVDAARDRLDLATRTLDKTKQEKQLLMTDIERIASL
jgi:hypothetical protein